MALRHHFWRWCWSGHQLQWTCGSSYSDLAADGTWRGRLRRSWMLWAAEVVDLEKPVKLWLKLDFIGECQDYWPLAYPKSDFCIRNLVLPAPTWSLAAPCAVTTCRIAYLRLMWSFGVFAARQQVVDYQDWPKTAEQSSRVYCAAMDQSPKNTTFERDGWMDRQNNS